MLAGFISQPDLTRERYDHILVWVERPLNAAQKARHIALLEQGVPVALAGPGVRANTGKLIVEAPVTQPAANQPDDQQTA